MEINYKLMITGISISLNAILALSQETGTLKDSPIKLNASDKSMQFV